MFAIYYGEDDYSRQEAIRSLRGKLGDPEMASLNTAIIQAKDARPAEVLVQASAIPFLASGRLVVVEGLLSLFEGRRGPAGGESRRNARSNRDAARSGDSLLGGWEALAQAGPSLPESNTLVLSDGPIGTANPVLRALAQVAETREFQPLHPPQLAEWVRKRVASQRGKITPEAVQRLVEACGSNLWAMDAEVSKLLLYAGSRQINQDDVEALVSEVREESIFNFVDDVIEGRYAQARVRLEKVLEGGAGTGQVIGMLGRQMRMLIAAKDLKERNASRQQLEEGLGTRSDFGLRKALTQADRFSMERLVQMHRRLLDYDLSIKTGVLSEDTALELLVAELCRVGREGRDIHQPLR